MSNDEEAKKEWEEKQPSLPKELCFLYGSFMEDYLFDVDICQKFACRNREKMAEILLEKMELEAVSSFHTIHNYIDTKEMILRKGAVSAKSGEKILIPINMRDGSLVCIGKGNEDWNCSAPHGAGRIMSRVQAKKVLSIEDYKTEMKDVFTTSVCEETIDEAPMVYKPMQEIIDNIKDTADIDSIIKPIYNFKAKE